MIPSGAAARRRVGWISAALIFVALAGLSLWIDPVAVRRTPVDPTGTPGFQSDEATYYLMGHSLVSDFDLEYRHEDIIRTRAEFPDGPSGVFLKRGTTIAGEPDTDSARLFYGKSFVYSLTAAPFVALFGTNGFYVWNSALLALGFLCAFLFLSARSSIGISLLLAGGFLFPTIVPVYWAWITPELFNCVFGLVAYFCWLYKFVAPTASSSWTRWLRGPSSDIVAALIIGVLTFSKISNGLLGAPLGLWWLWQRDWTRAGLVAVSFVLSAGLLLGANTIITGHWNYQGGGDRSTCHTAFPFETPTQGLEVCGSMSTDAALTNVWFDRDMFWRNLRANLGYFVVGRYGGVFAYFFPVVLATALFLVGSRTRQSWQWLVLGSIVAQVLLFLITQPYSYFGGGGSVGNRYFMGAYGMAVFLFPPVRSHLLSLLPWLVGGLFMAPLVFSPFDTSMRPGDRAFSGPLRLLPVELTNYLDLPVRTEGELMRRWFGVAGGHPGFELMYLDKNSWLQEADRLSFWTRADSRAELLVRANLPEERLELTLRAGPVP
ncbi:MAG: hypothetical protein O2917_08345, partial [Acidobacteria bacterium]|nr:hypothetical protein [Acidobacteriota bacterium]